MLRTWNVLTDLSDSEGRSGLWKMGGDGERGGRDAQGCTAAAAKAGSVDSL